MSSPERVLGAEIRANPLENHGTYQGVAKHLVDEAPLLLRQLRKRSRQFVSDGELGGDHRRITVFRGGWERLLFELGEPGHWGQPEIRFARQGGAGQAELGGQLLDPIGALRGPSRS